MFAILSGFTSVIQLNASLLMYEVLPHSLETHSSSVLGKLVEINFWFILHSDLFVIICKVNVNCFVLLNGLLVMLTSHRMPL